MKKYLILLVPLFLSFAPHAFATFSYSKSITVNAAQVPSTQTNFPVDVDLTQTGLKSTGNGGHVTNANGYDIYFYSTADCTTTRLPAEREIYTATTGKYTGWVNVSSISNGSVIYACYGDSSISTDPNLNGTFGATSVWDANFKGVWHVPDGTSLSVSDSTGLNTATNHGAQPVAGKIDGGSGHTSGSSQYIDLGSGAVDIGGSITFEQWINASTLTNVGSSVFPVSLSNIDGSAQNGYEIILSTGPKVYIQLVKSGSVLFAGSNSNVSANTWYHVVGTYDGTTGKLYVNGVQQTATISAANALGVSSQATSIGRRITNYWDGTIDETRISNIARSANWITTEYNNQSATSTFYTVGAETSLLTPFISRFLIQLGKMIVNSRLLIN